jgi:hypothetical protein
VSDAVSDKPTGCGFFSGESDSESDSSDEEETKEEPGGGEGTPQARNTNK